MTTRNAVLLLTFAVAVLLTPGLAAASPAAAPAADLSWLSCPAAGPEAAPALPALAAAGVEGAVPLSIDCCASRERKCRQDCWDTGVASFACSPATCGTTWTCICN